MQRETSPTTSSKVGFLIIGIVRVSVIGPQTPCPPAVSFKVMN